MCPTLADSAQPPACVCCPTFPCTQSIDPTTADLSCVWNAPLATTWPALRGEDPAPADEPASAPGTPAAAAAAAPAEVEEQEEQAAPAFK